VGKTPLTRAILTDIEGTTSSLSFVKDVLFPYARQRMADFVRAHRTAPAVMKLLDEARAIASGALDEDGLIDQLRRWIDEDRKITPLKNLQGMIWQEGYRQGELKGHVYDDAVGHLKKWKDADILIYIFSSGSILAQRLLFGHTAYGDLTPLFSGYFDTTIGAKKDPQAYRRIAAETGVEASDMLFLSDVSDELDAARAAGMRTLWLVREGPLLSGAGHTQVRDFSGVPLP
jgi:enolase-phosphatase E1